VSYKTLPWLGVSASRDILNGYHPSQMLVVITVEQENPKTPSVQRRSWTQNTARGLSGSNGSIARRTGLVRLRATRVAPESELNPFRKPLLSSGSRTGLSIRDVGIQVNDRRNSMGAQATVRSSNKVISPLNNSGAAANRYSVWGGSVAPG
jgi:hypothetical protein